MIKNSIPPEEMEKMINQELFEKFQEVHASILELVGRKFHDYGGMPLLEFRDLGIFIRTTSKYFRLRNLYKKDFSPKVDESVVDTWRDIAAYAIWAIALRKYTAEEKAAIEFYAEKESLKKPIPEGLLNEHKGRSRRSKRGGVQTGPHLSKAKGVDGKVSSHRKVKRTSPDGAGPR